MLGLLKAGLKKKVPVTEQDVEVPAIKVRKMPYTAINPDRTYGDTQNGGFGPTRKYKLSGADVFLSVSTGAYDKGFTELRVEAPNVFNVTISNLRGNHSSKLDAMMAILTGHLAELKDIAAHAQVTLGSQHASTPTQTPDIHKEPDESTEKASPDHRARPKPNKLRLSLPKPGQR